MKRYSKLLEISVIREKLENVIKDKYITEPPFKSMEAFELNKVIEQSLGELTCTVYFIINDLKKNKRDRLIKQSKFVSIEYMNLNRPLYLNFKFNEKGNFSIVTITNELPKESLKVDSINLDTRLKLNIEKELEKVYDVLLDEVLDTIEYSYINDRYYTKFKDKIS